MSEDTSEAASSLELTSEETSLDSLSEDEMDVSEDELELTPEEEVVPAQPAKTAAIRSAANKTGISFFM